MGATRGSTMLCLNLRRLRRALSTRLAVTCACAIAAAVVAQEPVARETVRGRIVKVAGEPVAITLHVGGAKADVTAQLTDDARILRRVSLPFDQTPTERNCFFYGDVDEAANVLTLRSVKAAPGLDGAKPGIHEYGGHHRVIGKLVHSGEALFVVVGDKRFAVHFETIPTLQVEEVGGRDDVQTGCLAYAYGARQEGVLRAESVTVLQSGKQPDAPLSGMALAGLVNADTLPDIDSCEQLSSRWTWNKAAVRIERETRIVHSGTGAVRVSFTGGRRDDKLWLMWERTFTPTLDLSGYTHLECWLYLDGPTTQYGDALLGHRALPSDKAAGTPVFDLKPTAWTRTLFPLGRMTHPQNTALWRFMVRPDKYPAGEQVSLIIDDIRAVRIPPSRDLTRLTRFPWTPRVEVRVPEQATFYPVMLLEAVYPDSSLHERPVLETAKVSACRGERAPATFALWSPRAVHDCRIAVSSLRGAAGAVLPADAADCRVVKVWRQSSPGQVRIVPDVSPEREIPELLVYDDARDFDDGFVERNGERVSYRPPPPIQPPLRTDIPAGTLKQFWLNVAVPPSARAGTYRGTLDVTGTGLDPLTLALEVAVLPWMLPRPAKRYGTYTWYVSDDPTNALHKSREQHLAELRLMQEAGMDAIACWVQRDRDVRFMLERMKSAGMTGPFATLGFFGSTADEKRRALADAAQFGIPIYFYGKDEPNNPARMEAHLERARATLAAGGKTMAAITVPYLRRLAAPDSLPYAIAPGPMVALEWANLAMDDTYAHFLSAHPMGEAPRLAPVQTTYWQYNVEIPTMNRFNAGFHLWATGMDGAFPNVFHSYPLVSPYNSDDRRVTRDRSGRDTVARHSCTVYPTQGEPISTLQWESWRLGINDVRYLTLLTQQTRQARRDGHGAAASAVERQLNELLAAFRLPPADEPGAPLPCLSARELLYVEPLMMIEARERVVALLRELESAIR